MIAVIQRPGSSARRILPLGTLMVSPAGVSAALVARRALGRLSGVRLGAASPATDPAAWAALAATLDPTSAFGREVGGCAVNPTAACYALAPQWFADQPNVVGQSSYGGVTAPLPTLKLAVSSGNLQTPAVGDRWTISIQGSGAWAGAPVTVYGSTGPSSGVRAESAEGRLDSNGNYSLSGSFTPDQIGAWYEDWKVAGRVVGNWTFTVAPAAPGPSAGSSSSSSGAGTPAGSPGGSGASAPGVFSFLSAPLGPLPLWVWIGAGVGGYLLFARGR